MPATALARRFGVRAVLTLGTLLGRRRLRPRRRSGGLVGTLHRPRTVRRGQQHAASARLGGHRPRLRIRRARAARHLQLHGRSREGGPTAPRRLSPCPRRLAAGPLADGGAAASSSRWPWRFCSHASPHRARIARRRRSRRPARGNIPPEDGIRPARRHRDADNAARPAFLILLAIPAPGEGRGTVARRRRLRPGRRGGALGKAAFGRLGERVGVTRCVITTEVGTAAAILAVVALPLAPGLVVLRCSA